MEREKAAPGTKQIAVDDVHSHWGSKLAPKRLRVYTDYDLLLRNMLNRHTGMYAHTQTHAHTHTHT